MIISVGEQAEFSSLYMVVQAHLKNKNTTFFQLSQSDESREVRLFLGCPVLAFIPMSG